MNFDVSGSNLTGLLGFLRNGGNGSLMWRVRHPEKSKRNSQTDGSIR